MERRASLLTLTTPWSHGAWSLRIGASARLAGLPAVLGALRPPFDQGAPGSPSGPEVRLLSDLAELALEPTGAPGRLVLDVDALPLEDLGYVRRWLDAPERSAVLVGDDPGRRAARTLLGRDRVSFVSWPPDLEQLERLLAPPARGADVRADVPTAVEARDETFEASWPSAAASPFDAGAAAPAAARAAGSTAVDEDELAVIRTILATPSGPRPAMRAEPPIRPAREEDEAEELPPYDVPAAWADEDEDEALGLLEDEDDVDEEEDRLDEQRAIEEARRRERATTDVLAPKAPPPPRYFRQQIADLADIAQSIDLALRTTDADTEPVARDVARLVQFTRTLGYLVAPPAQGQQELDLAILLEELVGQLVTRRPGAPRCLFRPEDDLVVRSDKQLLTQAFDALLYLAAACSDEHDVVRVRAWRHDPSDEGDEGDPFDDAPARAAVEIEFPAGPLEGLDPERIVEPYAVRDRLPELGPNALRAAMGILTGQGGRAELELVGEDRLGWTIELPLADPD